MARRSSLPGADELFRSTGPATPRGPLPEGQDELHLGLPPAEPAEDARRASSPAAGAAPVAEVVAVPAPVAAVPASVSAAVPVAATPVATPSTGSSRRSGGVRRVTRARTANGAGHQPSGRERHEEKITVYVSPQELLDLERARWVLRAEHGLASDRGRIVREAVAIILADLEAKGADSILVTRLQQG